jgi:anti-sigma factor RsiW
MISMNPFSNALSEMDHRYIDRHRVAQRYLDHSLSAQERAAFEAHLVDCQECTDRVLLAEMFEAREPNGLPKRQRTGLVLRLKAWQIVALLFTAALVLAAFVIPVFLR